MNNKLLLDSEQLNLKLIDHDKDAKDMSWLRYKRKYRVLKKRRQIKIEFLDVPIESKTKSTKRYLEWHSKITPY